MASLIFFSIAGRLGIDRIAANRAGMGNRIVPDDVVGGCQIKAKVWIGVFIIQKKPALIQNSLQTSRI